MHYLYLNRNGVDRSGLFCVMYAVIERLKLEQDVAITQVIEQMRCCRDQIIPSLVNFTCLTKVCESDDMYTNLLVKLAICK